uniref:hypothetical protein n=1 Tax=Paraburkholderia elongata TaxID=2675747 RepID=UPI001C12F7C7|nr:hypothetical protein [Paraburkholderia elongata]
MIAHDDRGQALLAYEWATLFALRTALRNGSVYVDHSFSFRSLATLLIPADEWQRQRNHFYGQLGVPQDPKAFLEPMIKHLDEGLERLREAVTRGEVRVDDAVHLDALKAIPSRRLLKSVGLNPVLASPVADGSLQGCFSLLCGDRGGGFADHVEHGAWLGEHRHMAARQLCGRGAHAL